MLVILMTKTNTLAYYALELIMAVQSFTIQGVTVSYCKSEKIS
jgi:hypothetical protein